MRDPLTQSRARELRNRLTKAEWRLWLYLRRRWLAGYKFRRQMPIGPYIADFACLSAAVIVELDGDQHSESRYEDYVRDEYLRERGFRVLRFSNLDVLKQVERVLNVIDAALKEASTGEVIGGGEKTPPPRSSPGDRGRTVRKGPEKKDT
ncbi:MAG: DUF559 domain-containing protein [Steroidobacteraceae bacterium]